ncbi:MAG: 30S ribosome-binding factor RbfA [Anaerolineaceae bacterium]|nr:30S ribosome-binding factor RbfA [Anaerolineaceae bacterium]
MATRRQQRVSELIHRELSQLLIREVRDPRLDEVTITEVRITPDLLLARVYFTVLGGAEEQQAARTGLESASGYLRTQLAGRVSLRLVPELSFEVDRSAEYGRRIDQLLDEISEESHPDDETEPSPGDQ